MSNKLYGTVLLSLNDDYYMPIGAILSKWATLEYQLHEIIWAAMRIGLKEGRTLTIGMGMQGTLGVMRNLHRQWVLDKPIQEEIASLAKTVAELSEKRNYIAHGVWMAMGDDANAVPHLTYMKTGAERVLPGAEPLTPSDLHAFALQIQTLNQQAEDILVKIKREQPASQKKPEPPHP